MNPFILSALMLAAALPAAAQSYGHEDPGETTTEQTALETVPSFHQVSPSGEGFIKPLEPPKAASPAVQRSAPPSPPPPTPADIQTKDSKSSKPQCHPKKPGYNKRGKKDSRCGKAQDKKDQQQQMKPPNLGGGGQEDKGKKKDPDSQAGTPGETRGGTTAPQHCQGSGGMCGDTEREKKVGGKLVEFKEPGLQPGDGDTQAPRSNNNPSDLGGELGSIRSYAPESLAGAVEEAIAGLTAAQQGFTGVAVSGVFDSEQETLDDAYREIMSSAEKKTRRAAKLDRMRVKANIGTVNAGISKLRDAGLRMTSDALRTARTLAAAVEQAGQADTQMMDAYSQLQTTIQQAVQLHATYQQLAASFNACPPPVPPAPPKPNTCKTAIQAQATAAKQAFQPDPAKQAAEQAFAAANRARGTLRQAESERRETEGSIVAFQAAERSALTAIANFKSDFSGLAAGQLGDANAEARIAALGGISGKASSAAAEMGSVYQLTFSPAWAKATSAMDSLAAIMDGR